MKVQVSPGPWRTGGSKMTSWFSQTDFVRKNSTAAQSGSFMGSDQTVGPGDRETWLDTTVTGPGSLGFSWKLLTSAPGSTTKLQFLIDGFEHASISEICDVHAAVFLPRPWHRMD